MGESKDREIIKMEKIPLSSHLSGPLFEEWYAVLQWIRKGRDVSQLMIGPYRMTFIHFVDLRLNYLCGGVLNPSSFEIIEPEVSVLDKRQRLVFNTTLIDMLKHSSSRCTDIEEQDIPSAENDSLEILHRFLELQSQPVSVPVEECEKQLNLYS